MLSRNPCVAGKDSSLPHFRFLALGLLLMLLVRSEPVAGQSIQVPFRFADASSITSVTVPGSFNGWQTSGPSVMQRVDSLEQWLRLQTLTVGQRVEYKFFVTTSSGGSWVTDPNNPDSNPADNNNSVLTVSDPAFFQPMGRINDQGLLTHVSAGVLTSSAVTRMTLSVGGGEAQDILSWYDPASRVVQVSLPQPVVAGTRFDLTATTESGTISVTQGTLVSPLALTSADRRTTESTFRLRGVATTGTGQVDPSLTSVQLQREGQFLRDVAVADGRIDTSVDLEPGANRFTLSATIDGVPMTSNEVVLTRWQGPLDGRWFTLTVSGSDGTFSIGIVETAASPGLASVAFSPDEQLSTTSWTGFSGAGTSASGTATGAGEIFVDVEATGPDGVTQHARVAIRIGRDGSISEYDWAETADWIDQAVVYEIFPLTFGPVEASGSVGNEGARFREITAELDYIAAMGFNTIWFMPIMQNLSMSQIGGGYNVIDFRTVDPKLGTNDDFKALVERAHELGIRIILDLTVNHSSPDHAWVQSLSDDGDYPGFVQTTPSAHNRGQDGKGASLSEQSSDNGLYRVYDGFGQLANLNWDNDDLRAEMMDIIAWWLTEFDVDGFRFDAYWGPWRRYGPDRFGRPVRELIRHLKPDSWILAEIEGVGEGTEVYYADDDNGNALAGGIDAGYDWTFSAYLRNPVYYGNISGYRDRMTNYGFYPGPNARLFRFLENHDEGRIQEVHKGNPDRIRPLTGLLMTGPGIPMVFQGQEVGYGEGSGDRRRLPVSWTTVDNGEWASWHRLWATARSRFPAFGTQDVSFLDAPSAAMAFVRPWQDENAVVLINFAGSSQTFTIDPSDAVLMSTDGPIPYYDLAADTSAAYLDGFSVEVGPYEVVTYITSDGADLGLGPLPALPFSGVYTGTESRQDIPTEALLMAPWPNPTYGSTRFEWRVDQPGVVEIALFDALGRKVRAIQHGFQQAGTHMVSVDLSGLASGLYLTRYRGPDAMETRSVIVARR